MLRSVLGILIAILLPFCAQAAVYKWVDSQGITHFSDQPQPGATKVEDIGDATEPTVTQLPPPSETPTNATTEGSGDPATVQLPTPAKTTNKPVSVIISSPQDQDTITPGEKSSFTALVSVTNLVGGMQVQLLVDGGVFASNTTGSFDLSSIDRGEHTLQAQVLSDSKKVIAKSKVITVYVKQGSAN